MWKESFLPRSKAPAPKLEVVDFSKLKPEEHKAMFCLQALTSRGQPCLWLINHAKDRYWLDWHVQKHYVDEYEIVADPLALFSKYAHCIKGTVIPDPDLYLGDTLGQVNPANPLP
ncbi:MAG: GxGYxYP domain-containing protein [Chthoniobacteraceae bacterium]